MTQCARACGPIITANADYGKYNGHKAHPTPILTESQVLMLLGRNNGFFDRHSFSKSLIECVSMYSKKLRYLREIKFFSINSVNPVYTSIVSLLFSSAPSAIRRFIMSIVVDPINSHALWLSPHIDKKILETIKPTITHNNPAPTIIMVKTIVRVIAPLFNAAPRLIGRACRKAALGVGLMKFTRSCRSLLFMKAATGLNEPSAQVASSYFFSIPTIAQAKPIALLLTITDYYKPIKSLVGQVFKRWHKINSLYLTQYHNNAIKQGGF